MRPEMCRKWFHILFLCNIYCISICQVILLPWNNITPMKVWSRAALPEHQRMENGYYGTKDEPVPEDQLGMLEEEEEEGFWAYDFGLSPSNGSYITIHEEKPLVERSNKCPQCFCGVKYRSRIVGGKVAERHEFPWMVYLKHSETGKFLCGGTLINDLYVLTAAHCTLRRSASDIIIRVRETFRDELEENAFSVRVAKVIRNSKHVKEKRLHDIALLQLQRRLTFQGALRPACLPGTQTSFTGENAVIIGWGLTSEKGKLVNRLRKATVPIMSNRVCRSTRYYKRIKSSMICAGRMRGGPDGCQGDSGGPLLVRRHDRYRIVGVSSFGKGCGRPRLPGVYTRVSKYLAWIKYNTRDACYCT